MSTHDGAGITAQPSNSRYGCRAQKDSWPSPRRELEQLQLGSFRRAAGSFRQRSEITTVERAILGRLQLAGPPLIQELTPAAS